MDSIHFGNNYITILVLPPTNLNVDNKMNSTTLEQSVSSGGKGAPTKARAQYSMWTESSPRRSSMRFFSSSVGVTPWTSADWVNIR